MSSATSVPSFHAVHKRFQTLDMQHADYKIPYTEKIHFYQDMYALYHACLWSKHTVLNSISDQPDLLTNTIELMKSIKSKHFLHCSLFDKLYYTLRHLKIDKPHGFTHTDHDTNDKPDTSNAVQGLSEKLAEVNITRKNIVELLTGHFQNECAVSKTSLFQNPASLSSPNASL